MISPDTELHEDVSSWLCRVYRLVSKLSKKQSIVLNKTISIRKNKIINIYPSKRRTFDVNCDGRFRIGK